MPLPPQRRQLRARTTSGPLRDDLKPLEIVQPDGPSFERRRARVRWQKWQLRDRLHAARGAGAAHRRLRGRRPRAADPAPRVVSRDGRAVRRPGARHICRKNAFDVRRVRASGLLANSLSSAATASARSATSTRRWPTARASRHDHAQRDLPARGGLRHPLEAHRLGGRARSRCAGRGGWSSRRSRPSATTSTASTGTSTRTARSSPR